MITAVLCKIYSLNDMTCFKRTLAKCWIEVLNKGIYFIVIWEIFILILIFDFMWNWSIHWNRRNSSCYDCNLWHVSIRYKCERMQFHFSSTIGLDFFPSQEKTLYDVRVCIHHFWDCFHIVYYMVDICLWQ